MRVAYIGNFEPAYSTETHVAQALRGLGHEVVQRQENGGMDTWFFNPRDYDFILWTRTGWAWASLGHEPAAVDAAQRGLLERARDAAVPTVGFHLDRWWGLSREDEVRTEPFFRSSLMVTADGGHEREWASVGVNHVWMPPAVSLYECELGTYRPQYEANIAFVGSWESYHPEWTHRPALIEHLHRLGARFWPDPGTVVRGDDLRNLYATTLVNVGDSCLIDNAINYWSDRVPETIGRGGLLLHPNVLGLEKHFGIGVHLDTWDLWDWAELERKISWYCNDPNLRRRVATAGREHVMLHHTYTARMQAVMALL